MRLKIVGDNFFLFLYPSQKVFVSADPYIPDEKSTCYFSVVKGYIKK